MVWYTFGISDGYPWYSFCTLHSLGRSNYLVHYLHSKRIGQFTPQSITLDELPDLVQTISHFRQFCICQRLSEINYLVFAKSDVLDKMQSHTTTSPLLDQTIDQNQIHALASMVIAQLPFPPMPMCVIKGEDNEDGICSSHDLLARAIALQYISSIKDTGSPMPSTQLTEKKTTILTCLLSDLFQISHDIQHQDIEDNVDMIYETFQRHFREFLYLYPCTSKDVRFAGLDMVDANSLIMTQAHSHLTAFHIQTDATGGLPSAQLPKPCNYREVLKQYFCELTCIANCTEQ